MKAISNVSISHQIRPLGSDPFQKSLPPLSTPPQNLKVAHKISPSLTRFRSLSAKTQQTHLSKDQNKTQDDGIPANYVKTLLKFKSRHNYIRVLEVSRRADHPFAGSRLLLLDNPGNIHSISFLFKFLTQTYFDVFATLPPILPPGPLGILGFGAGSTARLILHLYPHVEIHGWELDPSVISVGREYFGLSNLETENPKQLFVYIGDALNANVRDGFSGILVDLFCKGSVIPELQDWRTWEKLKRGLRKGGRIMVNCGGSCVESEDPRRDGNLIKEETLKAMDQVFPGRLFVLNLGNRNEDSCIALTGDLPDLDAWRQALPASLRFYADMWAPFHG
ncbi:S-adenosyl-L-methionine-dependent methyltransferases superfamily protein [Tasmannia lanceolata]|uniref:S-adenosyl-L-methionine-dependent methyltransferases superfamily protein n=1 Tax=Tasmannia lanceolata TaxID=3420 RepID=UPI004062F6A3